MAVSTKLAETLEWLAPGVVSSVIFARATTTINNSRVLYIGHGEAAAANVIDSWQVVLERPLIDDADYRIVYNAMPSAKLTVVVTFGTSSQIVYVVVNPGECAVLRPQGYFVLALELTSSSQQVLLAALRPASCKTKACTLVPLDQGATLEIGGTALAQCVCEDDQAGATGPPDLYRGEVASSQHVFAALLLMLLSSVEITFPTPRPPILPELPELGDARGITFTRDDMLRATVRFARSVTAVAVAGGQYVKARTLSDKGAPSEDEVTSYVAALLSAQLNEDRRIADRVDGMVMTDVLAVAGASSYNLGTEADISLFAEAVARRSAPLVLQLEPDAGLCAACCVVAAQVLSSVDSSVTSTVTFALNVGLKLQLQSVTEVASAAMAGLLLTSELLGLSGEQLHEAVAATVVAADRLSIDIVQDDLLGNVTALTDATAAAQQSADDATALAQQALDDLAKLQADVQALRDDLPVQELKDVAQELQIASQRIDRLEQQSANANDGRALLTGMVVAGVGIVAAVVVGSFFRGRRDHNRSSSLSLPVYAAPAPATTTSHGYDRERRRRKRRHGGPVP